MLYTIGYTAFKIREFIDILNKNNIKAVADVRSLPYSSHYPDYNKDNLERLLLANKIHYRNFNLEFGARQTSREFYSKEGYLDFEQFTKSQLFDSGYRLVIDILTKGYNIVLMCAEKDPASCHRSIMVTRAFAKNGIQATHILGTNSFESQGDLDKQLLDVYFPNRAQLSMFDEYTQEDLIEIAYKKRNAEIGYKIDEIK